MAGYCGMMRSKQYGIVIAGASTRHHGSNTTLHLAATCPYLPPTNVPQAHAIGLPEIAIGQATGHPNGSVPPRRQQ
jgi:hypothetical protein